MEAGRFPNAWFDTDEGGAPTSCRGCATRPQ